MRGVRFVILGALLLGFLFSLSAVAGDPEPEVVFSVASKKIEHVYLIGENDKLTLVRSEDYVWVYETDSGKKLWDKELEEPVYGNEEVQDGLYTYTTKKDKMFAYDLMTGELKWQKELEYKIKDYYDRIDFEGIFVLEFKKVWAGYNANTGEKIWEIEAPDLWDKYIEAGVPTIHYWDYDIGGRILAIGKKQSILIDVTNGQILGAYDIKFSDKNNTPTGNISKIGIALFGKNQTMAFNLQTGAVMWNIEEELDPGEELDPLEYKGKHYILLGLKKTLRLFDLDEGKEVWQTGEEFVIWPSDVMAYDNGILVVIGVKNHNPMREETWNWGPGGSHVLAYGMDFLTGEIKYTTRLAYYTTPGVYFKIPLVGLEVKNRYDVTEVYWDCPYGVLIYTYGLMGRKIQDETGIKVQWKEPGGEGFILMDPMTGDVKWRTNDWVLWENWNEYIPKANWRKPVPASTASLFQWYTPEPIFDGWDYVYQNANNRMIKLDLKTGKNVWESPEYGLMTATRIDNGRIFGEIGIGDWWPTHDAGRMESNDNHTMTKEIGYFILDEATGQQIWMEEPKKKQLPFNVMQEVYFRNAGKILGLDGETIRMLDIKNGDYVWTKELKKLVGPISAKEGVPYILTSSSSVYQGNWGGYSHYSVTKEYAPPTMELGIRMLDDNDFLVLGPKKVIKMNIAGDTIWETEWDWNTKKIQYKPVITQRGLLYQYKKWMTYISLEDGSVIWKSKERNAKDTNIFFNSAGDRMFLWDKKGVDVYKL